MKKFFALLTILLLASLASTQIAPFQGTLDDALAKAKAENKLVLVDFSSYT